MSGAAPLRVGVVGCGAVAEIHHLPALARSAAARAAVLVDPRPERAAALARRFGVPEVRTDLAAAAPLMEAAVVAVPNHLHAPVTVELLERGVPVLVEKPMARTAAECDRMLAAAAASGVPLAVGLEFRFFPAAEAVRRLLAAGVLGPLRRLELEQGVVLRWPVRSDYLFRRELAGGGVLLDFGTHLLDLLRWWLGEVELLAYRDDAVGEGLESNCELELGLPGGARGEMEISRNRDLSNRCRIEGERGWLEVGVWDPDPLLRLAVEGGEPVTVRARHQGGAAPTWASVYDRQLEGLVAAVRQGRPPRAPGGDGRAVIALVERCYARREPLEPPGRAVLSPAPPAAAALRGRRVLVTGATGFIGGRLAERLVLEVGAEVRALVRGYGSATRLACLPVEMVLGEVTDRAAVAAAADGCAAIFHCAYGTSGGPRARARVNVEGTRAVLEAAAATGARVVHLSTLMVYGETPEGDLDESAPRRRFGEAYADSKRQAERLVLARAGEGLPAVVLQPTAVYGPWGGVWTSRVLEELRTGRVVLVDGGEGLANTVYVDDLVTAMLLAAVREEALGEAFLISDGRPVPWRELVGGFEEMLGVRRTVTMTADEALAHWRRQRGAGAPLLPALRSVLGEEAVRERLLATAAAGRLRRLASTLLPEAAQTRLKERLRRSAAAPAAATGEEELPIHPLPPPLIRFLTTRTRVRIDKAERRLGFRPAVDLERGLAETEAWARWAGLLG